MGLFREILGRRREVRPNLDRLFLIPSAAITLETELGMSPTGAGSVCFRAPVGAGYQLVERDLLQLLDRGGPGEQVPSATVQQDSFGFSWFMVEATAGPDGSAVDGLCTDLHAVNTSLEAQDFAAGLLCTVVVFAEERTGRRVGLVYLYKQGTFYAFAPTGPQQRDNLTELQVRDALAKELPMETDLSRWMALWGAPGLGG